MKIALLHENCNFYFFWVAMMERNFLGDHNVSDFVRTPNRLDEKSLSKRLRDDIEPVTATSV